MTPLVSVVVPVYKVEDYLVRCVESILSQTYSNFELILVDDGSPDQCPKICDAYVDKDKRIKVIHKKNGGLSDARNAGTQIAQGEYITFIDSDDWVLSEYLEVLIESLTQNNAQISICGFQRVTDSSKEKVIRNRRIRTLNQLEALECLLYQKPFDNSACGKLYMTDIIKKHPYPKGKLFEDLATTYRVMEECERVVWVSDELYCYFYNSESITHQRFSPKRLDIVELVDEQYFYIIKRFPQLIRAARSRKYSAYCYAFRQLKNQDHEWDGQRESLWCYIRENRFAMLLDSKARLKNRAAALVACLGKNVFIKI